MKRKIMVEIDCGDDLCAKCWYRGKLTGMCNQFDKELAYNGVKLSKRCPECLSAEREANGEK